MATAVEILCFLFYFKSGGALTNTTGEENTSGSTPIPTLVQPPRSRRALPLLRTRSKSDPVLHHSEERGDVTPQALGRPLRFLDWC